MKDDRKLPEIPPEPVGSGRPEIYAVKTKNAGAFLTRRSFLGAMAAAGALSACDSGKSPNGAEGPKAPECLKPSHLGPVRGLLTIGDKLFSWCDHSFNVWSWPTGALVDKVMTNSDASVVWEPPEPFPVLFQRLGPGPRTVSFSADGRRLADIDVEKGLVEVWGSEGGAPTKIQAMAYGEWAMMSAGLSADGEMVAVGRTGGRIDIWNVGDQEPWRTLAEDEPRETSLTLTFIDVGLLISATGNDNLKIWNPMREQVTKTIPCGYTGVLLKAVTPSVDMAFVLSDRGNLLFVDLAAGQTIGKLPIDGETFTAAAVSPDGRLLAAGTDYGSVYLVDPRSALIIGCLDDPVFFPAGPEARRGSVMTVDVRSAPCGGARPVGENVTCRCHCVAGQSLFELPGAICSCDVITTKTGRFGPTFSCECDLVDLRPPSCSCDSHATRRSSGKHYWRPN